MCAGHMVVSGSLNSLRTPPRCSAVGPGWPKAGPGGRGGWKCTGWMWTLLQTCQLARVGPEDSVKARAHSALHQVLRTLDAQMIIPLSSTAASAISS